jgi:chemotaxis protein methyltransferase CheR
MERMSEKDFKRFSEFIYEEVGIKLPPTKKVMIEARLQKRLRALGIPTLREYVDFLFSPQGMEEELFQLIDVVTTNTTDFFREPQHFELLNERFLPDWYDRNNAHRCMRFWSAGCSFGMEPYTLGIVLSQFAERAAGFNFSILATDISTQALRAAANGVYAEERIDLVPGALKKKYFLRSKDRSKALVRVSPDVRRHVRFERLNFMEEFSFRAPFDVVFCRNVVIYFDKPTQQRLFTKLCRALGKGGLLFIGHSESLASMDLPIKQIVPTVYEKI